jgi:hypothetical protein
LIGGGFDGGFCLCCGVQWEKREAQAKCSGEIDSVRRLCLGKSLGKAARSPAPSPLAPSASTPPRWVRRPRAVSA